MAATQASIKVTKSFNFRGSPRTWSNRYYLNATSIDTQAHFNTFADNVVNFEKTILRSTVTITRVDYYAPGSEVAVWSRTYSTAGNLVTTGTAVPGECAALVRYSTTQRTAKNHPLYLFNYYHGISCQASPNQDTLAADYVTALGGYANDWVNGISDGVNTYKKASPKGAVAQGYVVETFATHRDFPR